MGSILWLHFPIIRWRDDLPFWGCEENQGRCSRTDVLSLNSRWGGVTSLVPSDCLPFSSPLLLLSPSCRKAHYLQCHRHRPQASTRWELRPGNPQRWDGAVAVPFLSTGQFPGTKRGVCYSVVMVPGCLWLHDLSALERYREWESFRGHFTTATHKEGRALERTQA